VNINLQDADVETLTESDLIEDKHELWKSVDQTPQFFVKYVELFKIMDMVIQMQHSQSNTLDRKAARIAQCEIALHEWLVNCPRSLIWDGESQDLWSAMLTSSY